MSTPSIRLLKFPLPPPANHLYAEAFNRLPLEQWPGIALGPDDARKLKPRVKSAKYREYEKICDDWAWQNIRQLNKVKAFIASTHPQAALRIDHIFLMKFGSIIGGNGGARKNDTFNRPKALHDQLARLLGIDDSRFWSGFCDKVPVESNELEGVIITISYWQVKPMEHYLDADADG